MSLSTEQVDAYLDRISLPQATRSMLRNWTSDDEAISAITDLQQHHMVAIPFENLNLHYSVERAMPQDMESIYENVIVQRRGGSCLQVSVLFAALLRTFGFQAYCAGGRLNAAAGTSPDGTVDKTKLSYGPWVHANTILKVNGKQYVIDTNFNQHGSPYPLPLTHDQPMTDVWTRERRLIHDSVPGLGYADVKWWRMQLRQSPTESWMDLYCFTETEWSAFDFAVLTAGLDKLNLGWFRTSVVCSRIIVENGKPVGHLMMWNDEIRKWYKGKTQVARKLFGESERVTFLAEEFGIVLTEENQKAILGTLTELKDESFDFYGDA